jgi:hypothetical protein
VPPFVVASYTAPTRARGPERHALPAPPACNRRGRLKHMQGLHLTATGAKGLEAVSQASHPRPSARPLVQLVSLAVSRYRTLPKQNRCRRRRANPPAPEQAPPAAPAPSPGSPVHCHATAGPPDRAIDRPGRAAAAVQMPHRRQYSTSPSPVWFSLKNYELSCTVTPGHLLRLGPAVTGC